MSGVVFLDRLANLSDVQTGNRALEGFSLATETLGNAALITEWIGEGIGIGTEERSYLKAGELALRGINATLTVVQGAENGGLQSNSGRLISSVIPFEEAYQDYIRLRNRDVSAQTARNASNRDEVANAVEQFIDYGNQVSQVSRRNHVSFNKRVKPEEPMISWLIEKGYLISRGVIQAGKIFVRTIPSSLKGTGLHLDIGRNLLNGAYCLYSAYQDEKSPLGISCASGKLEKKRPVSNEFQTYARDISHLELTASADFNTEFLASTALESMEWRFWQVIPSELLGHADLKFFICPILGKPMRFAVKPKSTGGVYYDREALQNWKIHNPGKNPPQWPVYINSVNEEEIEESDDAQFVIDGILLKICTNRLKALVGPTEHDVGFQLHQQVIRKKVFENFSFENFEKQDKEVRKGLLIKLSAYIENFQALQLVLPLHLFVRQIYADLVKAQKQLVLIDARMN